MGNPYKGFGAKIGLAEETTYGTAVAPSAFIRVLSAGITREIQDSTIPYLGGNDGATDRYSADTEEVVGGQLKLVPSYGGFGLVLKHSFGSVATTGVGPYTHTFTIPLELPTGLTIEQVMGTGSTEKFTGCKVNKFSFEVKAKAAYCEVSLDVIGRSSGGPTTATGVSYGTALEVLPRHCTGLVRNGVTYSVRSVQISLENGLERRNFAGSIQTDEPQRNQRATAKWSVEVEYSSDTPYSSHLARDKYDTTLAFVSGTNSMTFTLKNATVKVTKSVSSPGVIVENWELVGYADASNQAMSVVVVNGQSSAIAT